MRIKSGKELEKMLGKKRAGEIMKQQALFGGSDSTTRKQKPARAPKKASTIELPIRFTVPGDPVPKARARVVQNDGVAHAYTPTKTVEYERLISTCARQAMRNSAPIDAPLNVHVMVFTRIPKGMNQGDRVKAVAGELRPAVRPDGDNYLKIICDGMNGIVATDDGRFVDMRVSKFYSREPRMIVVITAGKNAKEILAEEDWQELR